MVGKMNKYVCTLFLLLHLSAQSYLALSLGNREIQNSWQSFKVTYNKSYESAEEEAVRAAIFISNLRKISHFNIWRSHELGYKLGLNHMFDLSRDETKKLLGNQIDSNTLLADNTSKGKQLLNQLINTQGDPPNEIDWRKVPHRVSSVKNQGDCASAWAFAAVGALEGQESYGLAGRNRDDDQLIELSAQNLVDCVLDNHGCFGGRIDSAYKWIDYEKGIEVESSYPYEAVRRKCRYRKELAAFIDTGSVTLPPGDEVALKKIVANFGPVAVAFDASNLSFLFYKKGVYNEPKCSNSTLNHAGLIVGYGSTKKEGDYWIVKNSWSKDWGEAGYIRMVRNKSNQCGIASMATIPVFY